MGGTLTTRDVCCRCNSRMGSEVDVCLTDSLLIRLLRFNFKDYLPPGSIPDFQLDAELCTPDGSQRIAGCIRFSRNGIEFQPKFDKQVEGNKTTYIVPDTPEGRAAYQGILNSRKKKIVHAVWFDLPPHKDCVTISQPGYLRYQRSLVKMCLGFVAAEISLTLATDKRFDTARQFIQGEIEDLGASGYGMRTGVTMTALELKDSVGHEIEFVVEDGHSLFSVILFDALQLQVEVEAQLPVLPVIKRRYSLQRRGRTLGGPLFRLFPP